MVYEHYDNQIASLTRRVEVLEEEIESLRNEIKQENILWYNLYNTTSTVAEDTVDIDMDKDFGQQDFT